jgi:hypothetical protein
VVVGAGRQPEHLSRDLGGHAAARILQLDAESRTIEADQQIEVDGGAQCDPRLQAYACFRVSDLDLPCERMLEVGLTVEDGSLRRERVDRLVQ